MKKIITIAATASLIAACVTGAALSGTAAELPSSETESVQVYLVPGAGNTLTGLEKADSDALNMEGDVYVAGKAGSTLPTPATTKTDGKGNAFTFNGWWYIVDATVTYTETVPEVTETTYLYADFRADLSQRKDPVAPQGGEAQEDKNYLIITHADGTEDKIPLLVSGTDVADAMDAGYGNPVQFFNEWFTLQKGDLIKVYVTGIYEGDDPVWAPKDGGVTFEGGGKSVSSDWVGTYDRTGGYTMYYIPEETHIFRVYIKFKSSGKTMTFYIEKLK